MHIGTARSALFNYLWARHMGGKFIVRIEDTDRERDKPEFEKDILDNLLWLGIRHDALYRQSDNAPRHEEVIRTLIAAGHAYVSKEPKKDNPSREVELIRFKNPRRTVTFTDLVKGEISVDTSDLEDFVIARSFTEPVHHLAVVVDDADEGVTLAMRGEDLLSNTPRQILIQEALGLPRPQYLHLPLILAPDRTKLSKRRHATSIGDYRDKGYLPEAVVNFLALLGWNPGTDEELFTIDELVMRFDIAQIQTSGAVLDETKMKWFNREYLKKLSDAEFLKHAQVDPRILPLVRERVSTFGEVPEVLKEFDFVNAVPPYDPKDLVWKNDPAPTRVVERLASVRKLLEKVSIWDADAVKAVVWPYAEQEGRGGVLWPLRYILTGKEKSPDPFTVAGILGRDETLVRIDTALRLLGD